MWPIKVNVSHNSSYIIFSSFNRTKISDFFYQSKVVLTKMSEKFAEKDEFRETLAAEAFSLIPIYDIKYAKGKVFDVV